MVNSSDGAIGDITTGGTTSSSDNCTRVGWGMKILTPVIIKYINILKYLFFKDKIKKSFIYVAKS